MQITPAVIDDIPELLSLVNSAYRGEASKQGWTTEAHLLKGDKRTDTVSLKKMLQTPGAIILKYPDDEQKIKGSVFLHKKGSKLYLGMLSVSPAAQAKGIGKQLLLAAEEYARRVECTSIYMTVISVRHELIAYYERRGYKKTGETQPFPADESFGKPTQFLEMLVLEKYL